MEYSAELIEKAKKIKLLICDVDGVLSDGKVYFGNDGEELKNFNIKDGLGIKLMQRNGIEVAIITGRQSNIVDHRAAELGIKHVYQGRSDKRETYQEILKKLNLNTEQVAHIGDDLPDLPPYANVRTRYLCRGWLFLCAKKCRLDYIQSRRRRCCQRCRGFLFVCSRKA